MPKRDTPAANHAYNLIWNRMPELQNRHTSIWWFFLLFPRQVAGYGPRQIMLTIVSKAGRALRINGVPQAGLDQPAPGNGRDEADRFHATVLGWVYDGRQMHEQWVHETAVATLRPEGCLEAWQPAAGGERRGGELRSNPARPFGITAEYAGRKGKAQFEVWGDARSEITRPADPLVVQMPLGGAHVVAWRQLHFEGDFSWPGGGERLGGVGYFQRIALNFNPFPWRWMWIAFEDQSVCSIFLPYVGPHLLRRGDRFFPQAMERAMIGVKGGGYFSRGDTRETTTFGRLRVAPILGQKAWPDFEVEARNAAGDFLRFRASSYAHAQVLLDEQVMRVLPFRYNYNEYLFEVADLDGRIGGRAVTAATVGQGFGNCEYTWGLGA